MLKLVFPASSWKFQKVSRRKAMRLFPSTIRTLETLVWACEWAWYYTYTRVICVSSGGKKRRKKRAKGEQSRGRGMKGATRHNHRWLPFITPRSKHGPESGPLGRLLHEERWFALAVRDVLGLDRERERRGIGRERESIWAPKSAGDTRTTRSGRDYAVDRFEEAGVLEARGKRLPRYAAENGS